MAATTMYDKFFEEGEVSSNSIDENTPSKEDLSRADTVKTQKPNSKGPIEGYNLVELLLDGPMNMVWKGFKVEDKNEKEPLVIKVARPNTQYYLRKEGEILTAIPTDMNHVVGMVDLGLTKLGGRFLTYRFIEGNDLNKHLTGLRERSEKMSLDNVIYVGVTLADTLVKLHEETFMFPTGNYDQMVAHSILHRDIKPANIMLDYTSVNEDGFCKPLFADFGIAVKVKMVKPAEGEEKAIYEIVCPSDDIDYIVGTAVFISPEVWKGDERVPLARDVFAYGATVYCMLSNGYNPFLGKSREEIERSIREDDHMSIEIFRRDVPKKLINLIEAMLNKDQYNRPTAIEAAAKFREI